MTKRLVLALAAVLPALATAGCSDFLTGSKLSNNPNRPVAADAYELFTGSQVNVMSQWETYPFNLFPLWAEQIVGVQRQWKDYSQLRSGTDELTADGAWQTLYGQGGYADLLAADTLAAALDNLVLRGEARVLRALLAGTAADIWGDVPFSEAGVTPQPKFDSQADVYAHVEALLDSAIADLQSGHGSGAHAGCSVQCDFFFRDTVPLWVATAHTLKARFYMHQTRGADSLTNFGLALAEAQQGISTPSGDLQTNHTSTFGEQNLFYQFLIGPRAGDVEPSQLHMDVIKAIGDSAQLLPLFYSKASNGTYLGSAAGQTGATGSISVSKFTMGATTPVGIVTYAENQMLLAEAQYRTGNPSDALATLDAYRASVGAPAVPGSPSGAQILVDIIEEKYARNLINPEVLFDYLRTCVPNIPMPASHSQSFNWVPARLPFPHSERTTNPNVPADDPIANANAPKNLTDPLGAPCAGQKDRVGP